MENEGKLFLAFLAALNKAVQTGKKEFVCPNCGGKAKWGRSEYNGHLHACCQQCGVGMIE